MAIAVHNTAVIWGEYIVTELFSVIKIPKPPDEAVFSYDIENLADGSWRDIGSTNKETTFSITVARETAKQDNIDLFKQLFNERKNYRLRLVNLTTGNVFVDYKTAKLANTDYMGDIGDGQGVDFTITWKVTNGKN